MAPIVWSSRFGLASRLVRFEDDVRGFMRFEGGEFEDDMGSRQRGSRMGSRMKAFDFDWYKFVTCRMSLNIKGCKHVCFDV